MSYAKMKRLLKSVLFFLIYTYFSMPAQADSRLENPYQITMLPGFGQTGNGLHLGYSLGQDWDTALIVVGSATGGRYGYSKSDGYASSGEYIFQDIGYQILEARYQFKGRLYASFGIMKYDGTYVYYYDQDDDTRVIGSHSYSNTDFEVEYKLKPWVGPCLGLGGNWIIKKKFVITYFFVTAVGDPKWESNATSANKAVRQSDLDQEANHEPYQMQGYLERTYTGLGIGYRF